MNIDEIKALIKRLQDCDPHLEQVDFSQTILTKEQCGLLYQAMRDNCYVLRLELPSHLPIADLEMTENFRGFITARVKENNESAQTLTMEYVENKLKAYQIRGAFSTAFAFLEHCPDSIKQSEKTIYLKGNLYLESADYNEAIDCFQRLLTSQTWSLLAKIHSNWAVFLQKPKQPVETLLQKLSALISQTQFPQYLSYAWKYKGFILMYQARLDEATAAYTQAVSYASNPCGILVYSGYCEILQNHPQRARNIFRQVLAEQTLSSDNWEYIFAEQGKIWLDAAISSQEEAKQRLFQIAKQKFETCFTSERFKERETEKLILKYLMGCLEKSMLKTKPVYLDPEELEENLTSALVTAPMSSSSIVEHPSISNGISSLSSTTTSIPVPSLSISSDIFAATSSIGSFASASASASASATTAALLPSSSVFALSPASANNFFISTTLPVEFFHSDHLKTRYKEQFTHIISILQHQYLLEEQFVNLMIVPDANLKATESSPSVSSSTSSAFATSASASASTPQRIPEPSSVGPKASLLHEDYFQQEQMLYSSRDIALADLFQDRQGKPVSRLLLTGRPGIGKTTLCRYILNQWAHDKLWSDRFQCIFYVPLRQLRTEATLRAVIKEMLGKQAPPNLTDSQAETIWQSLIGNPQIFILFDGYDEIITQASSHQKLKILLEEKLLKAPRFLLTSRPCEIKSVDFDLTLENIGFTEENISVYIKRYFKAKNITKGEQLTNLLTSQTLLLSMARTPINLELFCWLWEVNRLHVSSENPLTLTELYSELTLGLLTRFLDKRNEIQLDPRNADALSVPRDVRSVPNLQYTAFLEPEKKLIVPFLKHHFRHNPHLQNVLSLLEYLAIRGMSEDVIFLPGAWIADWCGRENNFVIKMERFLREIGFVRAVAIYETADRTETTQTFSPYYYFVHLSFQEFFAACYLARCFRQKRYAQVDLGTHRQSLSNFIAEYKYSPRFEYIWPFVSGLLTESEYKDYLDDLIKIFEDSPRDIFGYYHDVRLMLPCLDEARLRVKINLKEDLLKRLQCDHALIADHMDTSFFLQDFLRAIAYRPRIVEWILPAILQISQNPNISVPISKATIIALGNLKTLTPEQAEKILATLLKACGDENPLDVREAAITVLGNLKTLIPQQAERVLGAVLKACGDENPYVRQAAMTTLGNLKTLIPEQTERVLVTLLKACGDESPYVRQAAMTALGNLKTLIPEQTERVLVTLLKACGDESPYVRQAALTALGNLKTLIPEQTERVLVTLFKACEDKDSDVRQAAVRALENLKTLTPEQPERVLVTLLKACGDENPSDVREAAMTALGNLKTLIPEQTERVLPILLKACGDESLFFIREAAMTALGNLKTLTFEQTERVLPMLLKACGDENPSGVRKAAMTALRNLKTLTFEQTERVLVMLLKACGDENPFDVRETAMNTLMIMTALGNLKISTPEQTEIVLAMLLKAMLFKVYESYEYKYSGVRGVAMTAFMIVGNLKTLTPEQTERALATLLKACGDENSYVRETAITALGSLKTLTPEQTERALAMLLKACGDENPSDVREAAMTELKDLKTLSFEQTERVLPMLLKACGDKNFHVRQTAVTVLQNLFNYHLPCYINIEKTICFFYIDNDLQSLKINSIWEGSFLLATLVRVTEIIQERPSVFSTILSRLSFWGQSCVTSNNSSLPSIPPEISGSVRLNNTDPTRFSLIAIQVNHINARPLLKDYYDKLFGKLEQTILTIMVSTSTHEVMLNANYPGVSTVGSILEGMGALAGIPGSSATLTIVNTATGTVKMPGFIRCMEFLQSFGPAERDNFLKILARYMTLGREKLLYARLAKMRRDYKMSTASESAMAKIEPSFFSLARLFCDETLADGVIPHMIGEDTKEILALLKSGSINFSNEPKHDEYIHLCAHYIASKMIDASGELEESLGRFSNCLSVIDFLPLEYYQGIEYCQFKVPNNDAPHTGASLFYSLFIGLVLPHAQCSDLTSYNEQYEKLLGKSAEKDREMIHAALLDYDGSLSLFNTSLSFWILACFKDRVEKIGVEQTDENKELKSVVNFIGCAITLFKKDHGVNVTAIETISPDTSVSSVKETIILVRTLLPSTPQKDFYHYDCLLAKELIQSLPRFREKDNENHSRTASSIGLRPG